MSACTPAPWSFDESESGATTVRGPDGSLVALVAVRNGHGNARLIAASPELRRVLKVAVDCLVMAIRAGTEGLPGGFDPEDHLVVKEARAVLAKAEVR